MTAQTERRKQDPWTPLALLGLATIFGVMGWGGNQVLYDLKDNVVDIKNTQTKIWTVISDYQKKTDCLQNQLTKCCKDAIYCG